MPAMHSGSLGGSPRSRLRASPPATPVLLGGDFNSLPYKLASDQFDTVPPGSNIVSGVHQLLTEGSLGPSHQDHPAQRRAEEDVFALEHVNFTTSGLQLESALAAAWGCDPPVTNKTPSFAGCLDYVWVSPQHWEVVGALDLPYAWRRGQRAEPAQVQDLPPIPNKDFVSDHLAVGAGPCCCAFAVLERLLTKLARAVGVQRSTQANLAMGNACTTSKIDTKSARTNGPRVGSADATGRTLSSHASKLIRDQKVRDVYKMGKTLGTGGFSVVKLVTHRTSGEKYACKVMSLPAPGATATANDNTREDIFKEIDILIGLEHDNVIFLKEYFEEGNKVYLIMELLQGGELLDAVLEKGHYSEDDARTCFLQIMRGIMYLHSMGIVHRDLKLENLLLVEPKDISRIKIADFGLAKNAMAAALTTVCGTPQYVAPEVIKGGRGTKYGPACDLWSMGVILFILLGGYPPFYDESEPRLFDKIRKGKYDFNDKVWDPISSEAKDLIRSLLVVDPDKRLTTKQVMEHPWIKAGEKPAGKQNLLATTSRLRNSMRQFGSMVQRPPPELLDVKEEASVHDGAAGGAAAKAAA
ncbi:hypothetical protein N2152v2_000368 [Parachlorella kessleri]